MTRNDSSATDKHLKSKAVLQNVVRRYIVIAYHAAYNLCYIVGAQTIRLARRTGKRVVGGLVPVGRFLLRAVDYILIRHIRSLAGRIAAEAVRFARGFPIAGSRVRESFSQSVFCGIKTVFAIPYLAARRHSRTLATMVNLAAPAAAVFALVLTVQYWSGMTFALAVEYDGRTLGYISDEAVYDHAVNMVTDRVINTDNSFEVKRIPKLTIAVVSKSEIMDESTVCDKILESSGDSIAEASGLYIDGMFEGAIQSRSELDSLLDSILNIYRNGSSNERAEFVQDVEVVDGLYPISSITSTENMYAHLTSQSMVDKYYTVVKGDSPLLIAAKTDMSLAELRALNPGFDNNIFPDVRVMIQKAQPYLRVKIVRTVSYEEAIKFTTKTVQDQKQYVGYSAVRVNGVDGQQKVTAEITLIDGIENSRKILKTEVLKKPVEKVVVVGAKKVNNSISASGDGISTGKFIWPLPSCRTISSPFGYRWNGFHPAIDISGNGVYGKPVVAADGGRVVETNYGWGGGFGNYIIVDHGGGYRTLYAHLSAINVKLGQAVSKGQTIGRVGSSGNSTGPHLHFEIRINGRSVNPEPYVR